MQSPGSPRDCRKKGGGGDNKPPTGHKKDKIDTNKQFIKKKDGVKLKGNAADTIAERDGNCRGRERTNGAALSYR